MSEWRYDRADYEMVSERTLRRIANETLEAPGCAADMAREILETREILDDIMVKLMGNTRCQISALPAYLDGVLVRLNEAEGYSEVAED